MSDTPRRRLQIHLSTAVVMMFAAGGLVWVNVMPFSGHKTHEYWDETSGGDGELHRVEKPVIQFGWPISYRTDWTTFFHADGSGVTDWRHNLIFINLATALAILAAVTFACEWCIRRREARKP